MANDITRTVMANLTVSRRYSPAPFNCNKPGLQESDHRLLDELIRGTGAGIEKCKVRKSCTAEITLDDLAESVRLS